MSRCATYHEYLPDAVEGEKVAEKVEVSTFKCLRKVNPFLNRIKKLIG